MCVLKWSQHEGRITCTKLAHWYSKCSALKLELNERGVEQPESFLEINPDPTKSSQLKPTICKNSNL